MTGSMLCIYMCASVRVETAGKFSDRKGER